MRVPKYEQIIRGKKRGCRKMRGRKWSSVMLRRNEVGKGGGEDEDEEEESGGVKTIYMD